MDDHIVRIKWQDAESLVQSVNPALSGIIAAYARQSRENGLRLPDLHLMKYEYGDLIAEKGEFCPPCFASGTCDTCKELLKSPEYKSIPLSLVLENNVEVSYRTGNERLVPLRVVSPGEFYGVFETIDWLLESQTAGIQSSWNVSSGAQSLVLLFPTESEKFHERVRSYLGDYRTDFCPPAVEPYKMIKALSDKYYVNLSTDEQRRRPKWHTRVLVFPRQWVSQRTKKSGFAYNEFQKAVLALGWKQSAYLRHNRYAELDMRRKYQYYLVDKKKAVRSFLRVYALITFEHLKAIGRKEVPGFGLVKPGSCNGPLDEVIGVLKEVVLRNLSGWNHYPAILEPVQAGQETQLLLYSFSHPTVLDERPLLGTGEERRKREVSFRRDIIGPLDDFSEQFPGVLAPLDRNQLRLYYTSTGKKARTPDSPTTICFPNTELAGILAEQLKGQFTEQYNTICARVPFLTACASINF